MGSCCSCFKEEKEYHNTLISDKYCSQCQTTFISNIDIYQLVVKLMEIFKFSESISNIKQSK